jgi:adenylate cyclase
MVTVAAGLSAWKTWPFGFRPRSLAVLPFENADTDPDVEYLCEGLAESLMRRLSFLPDLDLRPRSAVFHVRSLGLDPADAGRRLRVDAILAGSVRVRTGRLQVAARLIDVERGTDLWRDHYDRPAADALAVQDDLARAIVTEGIRYPVDGATRQTLDRPPTTRSDANDLYLRALHFHRLAGEANYHHARELLQEAVSLDPAFALAQVSLASTFSVMTIDGFERPTEAWPAANRCVRRALDVEPNLPEARSEQSSSWFFFDHDWSAAESAWKHALGARPSPTLPDLLVSSAVKLWALGRGNEALDAARRARALDPLTPRFAIQEADLLLHIGHPDDAAGIYRAVVSTSPEEAGAHFGLAEAFYDQGRIAEALDARRRAHQMSGQPLPASSRGAAEQAYAAFERVAAEAELDAMAARSARGGYVSPLDCARARARLHDREGAFQDLDAAIEEQSPGLVFLRVDRAWRAVRDDRRFAAAIAAVGLP